MKGKKRNFGSGVTLIELMITVLAVMILVVGISGILAAGHRNYNTMFKRINSEVVRNGYEARSIFDRIVRKASIRGRVDDQLLDERDGWNDTYDELIIYYYSDANDLTIEDPNRYAIFHMDPVDPNLILEQGDIRPGTFSSGPVLEEPDSIGIIAQNISFESNVPGIFSKYGNNGFKMTLTLDNENIEGNKNKLETLKMTITSTAIRQNQ